MRWQDRKKLGVLLTAAGWKRQDGSSEFWSVRNTWERGGARVFVDTARCAYMLRQEGAFATWTEVARITVPGGLGWRERLVDAIDKEAQVVPV